MVFKLKAKTKPQVKDKALLAPEKSDQPLHIKYRPKTFEEVLGQEAVIASLVKVLSVHTPHAFLFTGPSGVGKTTLARILASELDCTENGITEIDAATHTGIDSMRQITEMVRYKALGAGTKRFVIVDECHALSKATWQSLLLAIEEPPEHVYWALCTTEPARVPDTIRTRCHAYDLKPVAWEPIAEYLFTVVSQEEMDVTEEVCGLIARKSAGSVRQALQHLSMLDGVHDKKAVTQILEEVTHEAEAVDLARFLANKQGQTWPEAIKKVEALGEANPESVRIVVVNYLSAVLMGQKSDKEAMRLLGALQAFSVPFNSSEKKAPLLLAIGLVILGE